MRSNRLLVRERETESRMRGRGRTKLKAHEFGLPDFTNRLAGCGQKDETRNRRAGYS